MAPRRVPLCPTTTSPACLVHPDIRVEEALTNTLLAFCSWRIVLGTVLVQYLRTKRRFVLRSQPSPSGTRLPRLLVFPISLAQLVRSVQQRSDLEKSSYSFLPLALHVVVGSKLASPSDYSKVATQVLRCIEGTDAETSTKYCE
jgi:hypothetical protein